MNDTKTNLKYFLYARKSSEAEDKQVASIDSQIDKLTELVKEKGYKVVEILKESKSAKAPDRPVFNEMLTRIHKGEAQGILCWKLNRLARNPVDGGQISWMLQNNVIQHIHAHDRSYLPTDNVMMMQVEFGMANQYVLDLSRDVKRGLENKVKQGWLPGVAPTGYLNTPNEEKGFKTVIKDPERFPLVRKMWDLMLTGNYTPPKIAKIADEEWGYRIKMRKKAGGTPISNSGIYRMFINPFYAGIITFNDKEYPGKHKPMITLDEFDEVQRLLGRKGRPRPKTHEFAFTGLIRCKECGCMITAEKKSKLIKSTNKKRSYTYYHCTRRKQGVECSQRSAIREETLEDMLHETLQKYTILPEFRTWALETLNESNDKEIEVRTKRYEMLKNSITTTQSELDALTKMRYREIIEEDQFIRSKEELQSTLFKLRQQTQDTDQRADEWLELTEKTFNFATYARSAFLNGDLQTKKEIISSLGQNFELLDGKLTFDANKWLVPISTSYPELEKEYLTSEPKVSIVNKRKNRALDSVRSDWLWGWDSNPRPID